MKLYLKYIKKNKINTLTIFLSIAITISLMVSMLVIRNTDEKLNYLISRYTTSVYDVTFANTSDQQAIGFACNDNIEHLGFYKVTNVVKSKQGISLPIVAGNEDYILRQSLLEQGKLPVDETELICEKWVLKNLDIEGKIGNEIELKIKNNSGKIQNKTYKLVGILSDNPYNKMNGVIEIYTALNQDTKGENLYASIKFEDGIEKEEALNDILEKNKINKENMISDYGDIVEISDTKYQITKENMIVLVVIFLISIIINYGVYRISTMDRRKEYGILQASGMKNKKLFFFMLKEMQIISISACIIGTILGIILSYSINLISKSIHTVFVFWGKTYNFSLEIPWNYISYTFICMWFSITLIVWLRYYELKKEPIVTKLKEEVDLNIKRQCFCIKNNESRYRTIIKIALKNMIRDYKSVIFVVLSIGFASALGLGLEYESSLKDRLEEEKYNVENLEGDFRLEEYNDLTTITGISDKVVRNIQKLEGVLAVETSMIMPSRLIGNSDVVVNKEYIDFLNQSFEDTFYHSISGNDGKEYVYKNTIKGFNSNALKKLKPFVIHGDYKVESLKGKKAILFMPQLDKNKGGIGFIKNGEPVMGYQVGDFITVKFRKDLDVSSNDYWALKDDIKQYRYVTFEIEAIVYYPYMAETSSIGSLVPDIIISEEQFRNLTGIEAYSVVNINTDKEYKDREKLEKEIIAISQKEKSISSRNLADEKDNKSNMLLRESVYRYGIEGFVLLVAIFNMINTIRYRFFLRKKEFYLYRAIGVQKERINHMIRIEGLLYGILSFFVACIGYIGFIIWFYDRNKTYYKAYGIEREIDLNKLIFILIINILICIFISTREQKKVNI